jgi:hypothetical protein
MAKFDAGTAVEPMEFDFAKYKGGTGEIPEPTTGLVNDFFVGMRGLIKDARELAGDDVASMDFEAMDGEELAAAFDKMDEKTATAMEFQKKSIALMSELCQGSPDAEALGKLPLRVLRAFNQWLLGEINPKKDGGSDQTDPTPLRPVPSDRRPVTKGTRKGSKRRTT